MKLQSNYSGADNSSIENSSIPASSTAEESS